jgi:hypothetical protein
MAGFFKVTLISTSTEWNVNRWLYTFTMPKQPEVTSLQERRSRRMDRQAKLRLANADRALEMRVARLATDPPSPGVTGAIPRINVGCSAGLIGTGGTCFIHKT